MDISHFEWKEEYSVKVKLFDDQHKQLIKTVDDLYQAIFSGGGKDSLNIIFASLNDYADTHFTAEEKYFQQYGYQEMDSHKELHDKFRKDLAIMEENSSGENTPIQLLFFLENWWINHIMDVDKRYSEFFNSKGVN